MKQIFSVFVFFFSFILGLHAHSPKREMRAVWLTSIYSLDWPGRPFKNANDINRQQGELIDILDKLEKANFNTVFLQTRLRGDVIYNSQIEPVSPYIRGVENAWPEYDPLAFAVSECHKRGLECHAWFVTYPFGRKKTDGKENASPALKEKKDKLKLVGNEFYLDPGDPETNAYLLSLIEEIVEKYDVDGIHMDYIRYPETGFPDDSTYSRYGKGKNRGNWRRENINRFVSELYEAVKNKKRWVQVSSSVIGMYKRMQDKVKRNYLTAYDGVYQDPVEWLRQESHDFVVPLMYHADDLFFPFVLDWKSKKQGRYVIPGLAVYKLDEKEGNWSINKIKEQINYSRENRMGGNVFFRARFLLNNKKGILDELKNNFYRYPALLPRMAWLDAVQPAPPERPEAMISGAYLFLRWKPTRQPDDKTVHYNVYRSKKFPVDINNVENLVAARVPDLMTFIPFNRSAKQGYYYVVTSYDRCHNESIPSRPVYFGTEN
jgi:uncharacterized lipoprotein YddW (UPF0748 family)